MTVRDCRAAAPIKRKALLMTSQAVRDPLADHIITPTESAYHDRWQPRRSRGRGGVDEPGTGCSENAVAP